MTEMEISHNEMPPISAPPPPLKKEIVLWELVSSFAGVAET